MARIAFGSQAGVGKDTSVDYLIRTYGGNKLAFASPLHATLVFVQKNLRLPVQKDREFLQWLGDWAKSKNPDVFVEMLLRNVSEEKDNVLVTDVRYPAEFRALKKEGFVLVKIERKNRLGSSSEDKGVRLHSSETSLQDAPWDYIVQNNGSVEELYSQLDQIFLLSGGVPVFSQLF